MMRATRFGFGPLVLACGSLALVAGCAGTKTEGQKKMSQLSEQMQQLGTQLTASKVDVQDMLKAHDMLVANADADLSGNFSRFADAIERCDTRQKDISTLMDQIAATSTSYFAGWQADLDRMSDAGLRERSEQRMAQVKGRLEQVETQVNTATTAFDPLLQTLHDHMVYLSNDLTSDSAASLSKDSSKLRTDVGSLYTALDKGMQPVKECEQALSTRPQT